MNALWRFCWLCGIFAAVLSGTPCAAQTPYTDQPRTIPNNAAPPVRTIPVTRLAPLPAETQGTIRRVNVGERNVVALTFDLCELAVNTTGYNAALINFLLENQLPATLFLGGKWMRTHSERTLELMAEPLFEIGNHAWSHGNFGIMDEAAMQQQVDWAQAQYELLREELERRHGVMPHVVQCPTFFRLPYGRCSDTALRLLSQAGLQVIQWDAVGEPFTNNNKPGLEKKVAAQVKPGSILLFHANGIPKGSTDILRRTVALLQHQGYTFVTVGQLLKMGTPQRTRNGYFSVPGDNLECDSQFGIDGTGVRRGK